MRYDVIVDNNINYRYQLNIVLDVAIKDIAYIRDRIYIAVESNVCTVTIEFVVR